MATTNFHERFEEAVPRALGALDALAPHLPESLPGLTLRQVKRIFRSIGRLLQRIDEGPVKFPEYLATPEGSAPEMAVQVLQQVPTIAASGAPSFINSSVSKLNDLQARLSYALGVNARTIRDTRDRQAAELQATLEASQQVLSSIQLLRRKSGEETKKVEGYAERIEAGREQAERDATTVKSIRETAQKLASGDARRGDSIEKFVRGAREKNEELQQLASAAIAHSRAVKEAEAEAQRAMESVSAGLERMAEAEKRAGEILRGATQVGLAGAYKTERDRLFKEQVMFAGAFYAINIAIVAYAAIWIVPVLSDAIEQANNGPTATESALMLLVRTVILAPAIAALIFTARRHAKLETLQMDYAAKANTALAYSGYRDEVGDDPTLATKLRDGLVVRFLEHPERLLSRSSATEEVDLGPQGVRYKSTSASSSEHTKDDSESDPG